MAVSNTFSLLLLCALIACFNSSIAKPRTGTLLRHINVVREIKQKRQAKKTSAKNQQKSPTQTESYLSVETLHETVEYHWSKQLEKHKDLIDAIMAKEKELSQTHYVFYHAQSGIFRVLQDLVSSVYHILNLTPEQAEFTLMRLWYESLESENVADFLHKEEQIDGGIQGRWDRRKDLREKLLSVNLSLFGNSTLIWGGECSFDYFINNYSIDPPNLDHLLTKFMHEIGLSEQDSHDFFDLLKTAYFQNIIASGLMIQIFIPKNRVDEYVYLSHPLGIPYEHPIADECFNHEKQRHEKMSPILEKYINHPQDIHHLDTLQARIILTQDFLLNPSSKVKIFRYSLLDENELSSYKANLSQFASKALSALVMPQIPKRHILIEKMPLCRLARFITNKKSNIPIKQKA